MQELAQNRCFRAWRVGVDDNEEILGSGGIVVLLGGEVEHRFLDGFCKVRSDWGIVHDWRLKMRTCSGESVAELHFLLAIGNVEVDLWVDRGDYIGDHLGGCEGCLNSRGLGRRNADG